MADFTSLLSGVGGVVMDEEEAVDPVLSRLGISEEEVDVCVRILRKAAEKVVLEEGHEEKLAVHAKPFKELRRALTPLLQVMSSKFPSDPDRYFREKDEKARRYARKQRQMRHDRNIIEKTRLRSERLQALAKLQMDGTDAAGGGGFDSSIDSRWPVWT